MNKKLIIFLIIVLMWMVTVFIFSNQTGSVSKDTSGKVIESAITILPEGESLSENQIQKIVKSYQLIVRKYAHFILYTIGGIVIYTFVNTFNISSKKKIVYTILIGMLIAITDEIHQYFVPGRTALVKDVVIDATGVIIGTLITSGIIKFIKSRKIRSKKEYKL